MTKFSLLLAGCFFWHIAAATLPPAPKAPPFPVIESNNSTYHVHNILGKDSLRYGTKNFPWKTLKYAIQKLRAGDTLIVHGTKTAYPLNQASLGHSGNEGEWITIKGKDGTNSERVVFLGRLTVGVQPQESASYLHLVNIVFQGSGAGHNIHINRGSHHIVFENIEIDCQSSPKNSRAVWTGNNVRFIWYKDMTVHHCGYKRNAHANPPPPDWKAPTDCGGICIKGDRIDEIVFLNVKATDNVGDGIGGGSKKAYGNSYFKNCVSARNTGDGFDLGGTRTVFINSISRDNGGHQGTGYKSWSKDLWLINSVSYNNSSAGVLVRPQHDGESHAYILNSTFARNSTDRYGGQISTSNRDPENGQLLFYIYNNIFYTLNSSAIVIGNNKTQIIREEGHNYYFSSHDGARKPHWTYAHAIHFRDGNMKVVDGYSFLEMADKGRWSSDTGNGAGNIGEIRSANKTDPGFLDLTGGDLRLSKGSLAIDAGIALGIFSDINGTPVPIGSAPDMGAYEFFGPRGGGAPAL